ncbi:hypothetical protein ABTU75_20000, partial [Acinetobacter baumannii]
GATYVPVNTAYRGNLLAHVVANAGSKLIVASADLVARLADLDRAELRACVVIGGPADAVPGLAMHDVGALDGDPATLPALT